MHLQQNLNVITTSYTVAKALWGYVNESTYCVLIKKNHSIRSADGHHQCFSGKHYSSSIHQSASALNRSIHPPPLEIVKIVLCGRKQRKDLKENINHPSIDKEAIFHNFFPILTLVFPTQHYFEYFQGAG